MLTPWVVPRGRPAPARPHGTQEAPSKAVKAERRSEPSALRRVRVPTGRCAEVDAARLGCAGHPMAVLRNPPVDRLGKPADRRPDDEMAGYRPETASGDEGLTDPEVSSVRRAVIVDPVGGGADVLLGQPVIVQLQDLPGRDPHVGRESALDPLRRGGAEPAVAIEDQEHAPLSLATGALRHCGSCMIS